MFSDHVHSPGHADIPVHAYGFLVCSPGNMSEICKSFYEHLILSFLLKFLSSYLFSCHSFTASGSCQVKQLPLLFFNKFSKEKGVHNGGAPN